MSHYDSNTDLEIHAHDLSHQSKNWGLFMVQISPQIFCGRVRSLPEGSDLFWLGFGQAVYLYARNCIIGWQYRRVTFCHFM